VKAKGKYVLLHGCGNIEDVFPDLIEIGLDVYNTVQPEIYNLKKIKAEYGKDLTFWGAISTQQFLPQSRPEEVFDRSVETIRILGEGGGYIFSPTHAVMPDIPVANIRAMLDAARSIQW
jgi:uroporphyrinogen decarboxylase